MILSRAVWNGLCLLLTSHAHILILILVTKSLIHQLHNWLDHDLFQNINAQDVMVQLNHRSAEDDQILNDFNNRLASIDQPPISIMGSSEDNLNPGLAISKYCRAAEAHPNSHPLGKNLLLFLEKVSSLYSVCCLVTLLLISLNL